MTREELEHAIRAACDVAGDAEVYVFGSQSILGQFPDAPDALRQSAEADVVPKNHPERADLIDAALGELSPFHRTHGFYVHGISLETAVLPAGWERRTRMIRNENTHQHTGWCLEGHDLAASKLVAFREKDRDFVRVLLRHGLVKQARLLRMIGMLPVDEERRARLKRWVGATIRELAEAREEPGS